MKLARVLIVLALLAVVPVVWGAGESTKVAVSVTPLHALADDYSAIETVLPKVVATLRGVELASDGDRLTVAYMVASGDELVAWAVFHKNEPNGYKGEKTYTYKKGGEEQVSKLIARDFARYCLR